MSAYNFVVSGPKFTNFFLFNAGEIVLVKAVYSLSISTSVSKKFALKVFLNHAKFWTFFALPNFKGAVPPKPCTQFIMLRERHVMCQSFVGLHPLTMTL